MRSKYRRQYAAYRVPLLIIQKNQLLIAVFRRLCYNINTTDAFLRKERCEPACAGLHCTQTMYVIGIAGGSGSGKSTFSEKIQNAFREEATVLRCDNYYHPYAELTLEERKLMSYDAPESIDFELMTEHVYSLKAGHPIECPQYDFAQYTRTGETVLMQPSPILILDGILLFTHKPLRDLMDLKIYVDTDADERILRRARRDIVERGRTIDSVIEQYISTVKPMHYIHVEPTKAFADVIVNGGMNPVALDLVLNKISRIIENDIYPYEDKSRYM